MSIQLNYTDDGEALLIVSDTSESVFLSVPELEQLRHILGDSERFIDQVYGIALLDRDHSESEVITRLRELSRE